ncbi:MAG: hypothetical protein JWR88_2401 [Pseudonocardia sp.]|jgi:hypothetical protein|nr:hypothetical protein [Pseudonocardia sp.]
MPLTAVLALVDGLAAAALLLSVPRQRQNKAAVLAVAAVLIGVAGWLAVLAVTPHSNPDEPVPLPPLSGPTA